MKTYSLTLKGVNALIGDLGKRRKDLEKKADELAKRLAEMGVQSATAKFDAAEYDGIKSYDITMEKIEDGHYAVKACGESILFIEFGTGITYAAGGHPQAAEFGMGAGTYPGQKHAMDPNGWYLPKSIQAATGKTKSYGNPPYAPMYSTARDLERDVLRIAKEVLGND